VFTLDDENGMIQVDKKLLNIYEF